MKHHPSLFPDFKETGAAFDPTGAYRYTLLRRWNDGPKIACWIMLNPSTADAEVLDPTIKRCVAFSKRLACDALEVVNLFAFRATDPDVMIAAPEPIGADNDEAIIAAAGRAHTIIVAWGEKGRYRARSQQALDLLKPWPLFCLGLCKNGEPYHPLYLDGETELQEFRKPIAAPPPHPSL